MPPLSLNLPDDLKAKAQARARSAGHASLETYIESLIVADVNAAVDEGPGAPDPCRFAPPPTLRDKSFRAFQAGQRGSWQMPIGTRSDAA
jgi:hypothetical protein